MEKLSFRSVVRPALILFLICLVSVTALVGTNAVTADRIEEAKLKTAEESRKIVMPAADGFQEEDGYYTALAGGNEIGYVFETESKGYGGTVRVMTGISSDGKITGVVILSHGETPGLGANAEREAYRDQYKQDAPEQGLSVVKNQPAGAGQVEAVTGATITSNAVTNAVNDAVQMYYGLKGGT